MTPYSAMLVCALFLAPAPTPVVVAYRGLLREAPENTHAAFAACLDLNLGFELDVRRSRDGALVIVHDATLDRTTNGTGAVADQTLAQLKALDAGSWFDPAFAGQRVPTLDEVFALVKERARKGTVVCVDLKADDVETDVVRLAKKHGVLDRILCIGTAIDAPAVRRRLCEADAKTQVAVLAQTAADLGKALEDRDASWAYLRFVPTREQVARARNAGKKVIVVGTTVMGLEPENWRRVREAGADALLTDYPLDCRRTWRESRRR